MRDSPANPYLYPLLPVTRTGLRGRCPRCGEGRLFAGYLKTAEACPHCALDYEFIDSGDGPAIFVIFIAGFLAVTGVLLTEIAFAPPIWLNLALWLPLTVIMCLALLRPLKGLMIALQYRYKAAEGKREDDSHS